MKTLREKITFILTGLAWLICHISTNATGINSGSDAATIISGANAASILSGTFIQVLTLAPYSIGLTYILLILIRYFSGGTIPPWDRIVRIFFTIGILFALYSSLYGIGERAEKLRKEQKENPINVSRIYLNENQKVKLYWA